MAMLVSSVKLSVAEGTQVILSHYVAAGADVRNDERP
jgi:hypothetical protein